MFDYSNKELEAIDQVLEPKLAWAKDRTVEAEQLALDATRLLSCTEERLGEIYDRGFFTRCWYSLSGKHGEVARANQNDLISMQKTAWRYINLLQERDLMLAHSILTIKNNLMTLAVDQEDTRKQIAFMAQKVYDRFIALEDRMKQVEVSTKIHSWLLTLDTFDYDEKYPPNFRLLRIIGEFYSLKSDEWNVQELKYLQKAIKEVDLPWKKNIKIAEFVDGLVDEIEDRAFQEYYSLLTMGHNNIGVLVPESFILENISVPSYTALYHIADDYTGSSATIEVLVEQLDIDKKDAIKKVLKTFISKQGVDLNIPIPLRDLGVELLTCMRLSRNLFQPNDNVAKSEPEAEPRPTTKAVPDDIISNNDETNKEAGESCDGDLLSLAETGDVNAQYKLGMAYFIGDIYPQDDAKSFEWFMKAAENGHATALARVGQMYQIGAGVHEDFGKAHEYYQKAVELGDEEGMFCLGELYSSGEHVEQDSDKAASLFEKAAEKGHYKSLLNLSMIFLMGKGREKSVSKAKDILLEALKDELYSKDEIVRDFVNMLGAKLCDNSSFYLSENIPPKKMKNASKTFLKPIIDNKDDLLIFYDDTLFGSAKEGLAISNKRVSWKGDFEGPREKPLVWSGFSKCEVVKGYIVLDKDNSIHMSQTGDDETDLFCSLFQVLHAIKVQ